MNVLTEIRSRIPEQKWPWYACSLRQDTLIWQCLQQEAFINSLLPMGDMSEEYFAPGACALQALGISIKPKEFRSSSEIALGSNLLQRAIQIHDLFLNNQSEAKTIQEKWLPLKRLAHVGMLCLALREERRKYGNWSFLVGNIQQTSAACVETWKTVLVCLFDLCSDPLDMIASLLQADELSQNDQSEIIIHAILSQPNPPEVQVEQIVCLIAKSREEDPSISLKQIQILRSVKALRPDLAQHAAQIVCQTLAHTDSSTGQVSGNILERIQILELQSELQWLANDSSASVKTIQQVARLARQIEAASTAHWNQLAQNNNLPDEVAISNTDLINAWIHILGSLTDESSLAEIIEYQHSHALALIQSGDPDEIKKWTADGNNLSEHQPSYAALSIFLILARRAIESHELEKAKVYTRLAYEICVRLKHDVDYLFWGVQLPYNTLANLLLELGMAKEGLQIAQLGRQDHPDGTGLILTISKLQIAIKNLPGAAESLYLASTLKPYALDIRRSLADTLEKLGNWQAALRERSAILNQFHGETTQQQKKDLLALADCAINIDATDQAAVACQQALALDPEDGKVQCLMGKLARSIGNLADSQEYYRQATLLTPDLEEGWVSLAEIYRQAGELQEESATLRSAAQAIPDSFAIQVKLGETYRENHNPSLALESFTHAYELLSAQRNPVAPDVRWQVILRLGQTQNQLGYYQQACLLLASAFDEQSAKGEIDNELAYTYAKALLAMNEYHQAIAPLQHVIESEPAQAAPYFDYGRAILAVSGAPEQAARALQKVLVLEPKNYQAQALLAEAIAESGDSHTAIAHYLKALESELVNDSAWQARISYGLGRASLRQGQIDTAVAALQDAVQIEPRNPNYQRSLAEAYWAANLSYSAWQAARSALKLDSANPDMLIWFAEQANCLYQQTKQSLQANKNINDSNRCAGIDPQQILEETLTILQHTQKASSKNRSDYLIQLGHLQALAGKSQQALETFHLLDEISTAAPADLYQASQELQGLNDLPGTIQMLERAIDTCQKQHVPVPILYYRQLAEAFQKDGDLIRALGTLDQALAIETGDASLYQAQADLMLEMGQTSNALQHLENAIQNTNEIEPRAFLSYRLAQIQRSIGQPKAALTNASHSIEWIMELPDVAAAHYLPEVYQFKVEIAQAMLLNQEVLETGKAESVCHQAVFPDLESNDEQVYARLCQCAVLEAALDMQHMIDVTPYWEIITRCTVQHPRIEAMRARFLLRQKDYSAALEALNNAQEMYRTMNQDDAGGSTTLPKQAQTEKRGSQAKLKEISQAAVQVSLALAAAELYEWQSALQFAKQAIQLNPYEARPYYTLLRVLVCQAENQLLCQDLLILNHAPGASVLSHENYQLFRTTLDRVKSILADETTGGQFIIDEERSTWLAEIDQLIMHWELRGVAVFTPEQTQVKASLPAEKFPEEVADYLAALRFSGNPAAVEAARQAASAYPEQAVVQTQAALTLIHIEIDSALKSAHASYKLMATPCNCPETAISLVLLALVSGEAGDLPAARTTIQGALDIWADEPRWHALAARYILQMVDYHFSEDMKETATVTQAITHLEEAVRLEPNHIPHYLALSDAYLHDLPNDPMAPRRAVRVLERACRLDTQSAELWQALAKAHRLSEAENALEQAAGCAERAIGLAGNQHTSSSQLTYLNACILRADIALEMGNAQMALHRSREALRSQPGNSEALLIQVRALEALERPSEALETLEKVLPFSSDPLSLNIKRARLIRSMQGSQAALPVAKNISDQYPTSPQAQYLLAQLQAETGADELATQSAQGALRAISQQENVFTSQEMAEIHLMLGRLMARAGQLDNAIHHLKQAVSQREDLLDAYLELGSVFEKQRQNIKARQIYQQATRIAPTDPRPFIKAGLALRDGKDYENAATMLKRASELDPNNLDIKSTLFGVMAVNLIHGKSMAETE